MSLDLFLCKAPCCVLAHAVLEGVFEPTLLDRLFNSTAQLQYTRELLFSHAVALMADVACRIQPSVYAAWRKAHGDRLVTVSAAALRASPLGQRLGVLEFSDAPPEEEYEYEEDDEAF